MPALALLIAACLTDVLDGPAARARGTASEMGARLDVLADGVVVLAMAFALVYLGLYPVWVLILLGFMLAQFVMSWRRRGVRYDPIGKWFGACVLGLEVATIALPTDPVPLIAAWSMAAIGLASLVSRFLHLRPPSGV